MDDHQKREKRVSNSRHHKSKTTPPPNKLSVEDIQKVECEVCLETLTSKPIFSCKTCYNLVCKTCITQVSRCPFCRADGAHFSERNYAVERFISTLSLPCRYERYGCNMLLNRNTRDRHEKICFYEPVYCPYSHWCNFCSKVEDLQQHMFKIHKIDLLYTSGHKIVIKAVRDKLNSTITTKISRFIILYCQDNFFFYCIGLHKNSIQFTFKHMKSNKAKVFKEYGFFLKISSPTHALKGIIPISQQDCKKEIELPQHLIISDEFEGVDDVDIIMDIKCLDDLLK